MSESETIPTEPFLKKYQFWLVFIAAFIIVEIPIISIPIKWFETYFHEISHGLAAIISGGEIKRIQLFLNGAGLCTTLGGSNFLISFFGYAGAAIWGVVIYSAAGFHQRVAQLFSGVVILLLIITIAFWLSDLLSFIIVSILLAVMLLKFKLTKVSYFQWTLQLIGAAVLLNSIKSPLYLLDGRSLGDGAALTQATMIPEIIWVAIWCLLGILGVLFLHRTKA